MRVGHLDLLDDGGRHLEARGRDESQLRTLHPTPLTLLLDTLDLRFVTKFSLSLPPCPLRSP